MTWQCSDPYAGFLFHYYSRAIHYGKGRVYTTMRCVGFQTILIRGVEWATTGSVTYPGPKDSQLLPRSSCQPQLRSPRKPPGSITINEQIGAVYCLSRVLN